MRGERGKPAVTGEGSPYFLFRARPIIIMGMSTQTIVFALNDENLKRMIREAAKDTARVFFAPPREKADEAAQDHADAGL